MSPKAPPHILQLQSEINQCRNVTDVIVCLSDKVYYTAAASNVVSLVHLVWIQ